MANRPKSQFQNQEFIDNQENVEFPGGLGQAKRVVLFDADGNEATLPAAGSGVEDGTITVTTAGTPVQVTATPTPIKGVWVCADLIAGIVVTVGTSTVEGASTGMRGVILTPGNPPIFLFINDLSLLWVDAQANNGKLSYLTVT